MNLFLILGVLGSDIVHLELGVIFDLPDGFIVIKLLVFDFLSHLLSLSSLGLHCSMIFIHQRIYLLVVSFNNISNSLFKVSGFLFFFGLKFLELSCILKHLLGVGVSIFFELNLLVFNLSFNFLFENWFKIFFVFHEGVISISMLQLRTR